MQKNQIQIGIILSYLAQFIQIISGLIYTPIMLRFLGPSEYGLYQLIYSVVSYLSLLSMGFDSSYIRFYSKYKAINNQKEISRLNGMFMVIFCSISLICIFCGIIMLNNIQAIFGTSITLSELSIAKILIGLMIINLAITFPNSVFNCFITAHEAFFFQKLLILLQSLLNPFLTFPLLVLGYGSVGMVSITTILTLSVFILNIYYCIKKLHMQFIFKEFNWTLLKEMWIFTFFIFLNQIIDQVNWSVDKFLLGRLVGTTAVAVYGVGAQINTMYIQFSVTISSIFVPHVNRIIAESNNDKEITRLFVKVGRMQFIIINLILTGFIFFGKPFIGFWAGAGYEAAYYITLFLIIPITIPLLQNLGIEIQRAKNKHQTRSIVYLLIAVINIFISLYLIKLFGPVGASMGTALALILGNVLFMNWYYHNKIGINIIYFWKEIAKFIPALMLTCIVGIVINQFIQFSHLITLGLWAIVYTVVYCTSMWFLGMNEDEKQTVNESINKLKKFFVKRYTKISVK